MESISQKLRLISENKSIIFQYKLIFPMQLNKIRKIRAVVSYDIVISQKISYFGRHFALQETKRIKESEKQTDFEAL